MKRSAATLLVASSLMLAILVPGGPIETRSFSHIAPLILGTFNTFLTTLGLGSLALAYFVLKERQWAFALSAACGISYFLVYVLDLGKIFPVSPDAMPTALLAIEVAGTLAALPLTYLSLKLFRMQPDQGSRPAHATGMGKAHALLLGVMLAAGTGIIVFATLSAMGR